GLRGGTVLEVGVFFASRRRHTRFKCDWSSDVCCSDLCASATATLVWGVMDSLSRMLPSLKRRANSSLLSRPDRATPPLPAYVVEIGRASCRDRRSIRVVVVW